MGAETDLSPPVPVPALSPEPDVGGHDNQGWKADMMSALGESVSFGRFLSEPLDWGKWSAFAHNRYLEEAARQARPGSVAQKKALFEAHYARKRQREEAAAAAADDQGGGYEEDPAAVSDGSGGGGASLSSSAAGSSCMTDDAAAGQEQEVCGGGGDSDAVECGGGGGGGGDGPAGVAEEVEAITDGVGSACRMDESANNSCHVEPDAPAVGATHEQQLCISGPAEAVQKQPLKEISIVNQDTPESAKKRRLQMPSLLQKPTKFSSPSSGKKGQSSSAKRRSALHSSKENTSPASIDSTKREAASVPKRRSTLPTLHMSMGFSRCETGNAASSSRNLGTTIAETINQLQSASRPVENTQPEEFRPQRKTLSRALPEFAPRTSQSDEQRSSHVMRVKEKLFGSTSPSVTQKKGITKEKEKKLNNEAGFKESRQSFCFKGRPLPNFSRKNKQEKDSNQQIAQDIQHLPNRLLGDVNHAHQVGKGVSKEKQICCFPIRKLY